MHTRGSCLLLFALAGCGSSMSPTDAATDAARVDRSVTQDVFAFVDSPVPDVTDASRVDITDVPFDQGNDLGAADTGIDATLDAGEDASEDLAFDTGTDVPTCKVPTMGGDGGYVALVEPILAAHCALPTCHDAVTMEAGMNLSPGHGYASLVCAPASIGCPSAHVRVWPSHAESSVMWLRISGASCYQQMPLGVDGDASMPLPMDLQTAIEGWIDDGALP